MNITPWDFAKKVLFNMSYGIMCSDACARVHERDASGHKIEKDSRLSHGLLLYTIFQVVFSLSLSTSLEGSVIKINTAASVPMNTTCSKLGSLAS